VLRVYHTIIATRPGPIIFIFPMGAPLSSRWCELSSRSFSIPYPNLSPWSLVRALTVVVEIRGNGVRWWWLYRHLTERRINGAVTTESEVEVRVLIYSGGKGLTIEVVGRAAGGDVAEASPQPMSGGRDQRGRTPQDEGIGEERGGHRRRKTSSRERVLRFPYRATHRGSYPHHLAATIKS
jgi:hypothetical protein